MAFFAIFLCVLCGNHLTARDARVFRKERKGDGIPIFLRPLRISLRSLRLNGYRKERKGFSQGAQGGGIQIFCDLCEILCVLCG